MLATCLSAGVAGAASAADARYLYLLDCSADVRKLDTTTGRVISSTNLARRSPWVPTHGDAANSVPDGCSTYGVAYSAAEHVLYTVAPVTGSMHGTPRRYRVLTFSLPGLRAGPAIELREAFGDEDAPALDRDAGAITLSGNGRTWRLVDGRFVPSPNGRPPGADVGPDRPDPGHERASSDVDAPASDGAASTPLERSGGVALVRLFGTGGTAAYATVNADRAKSIPLKLPFGTLDERIHLGPGGKVVVVQEARHGAAGTAITTGRLAVLDAASGEVVKAWTEAAVAGWFLLTVTPKGQAVFYRGGETRLVAAAVEVQRGAVTTLQHEPGPAFFYADR